VKFPVPTSRSREAAPDTVPIVTTLATAPSAMLTTLAAVAPPAISTVVAPSPEPI